MSKEKKNIIEGNGFYASAPYYDLNYDGKELIDLMQGELRQKGIIGDVPKEVLKNKGKRNIGGFFRAISKKFSFISKIFRAGEKKIEKPNIIQGNGFYASMPYGVEFDERISIRLMKEELKKRRIIEDTQKEKILKPIKINPSKAL